MRVMPRRGTSRLLRALLAATCLVVLVAAHAEAQNIPVPSDVSAPPSDAEKSSSGLASKVLTAGTGTTHPRASSSGHGALHRLDDGRRHVRQFGESRRAVDLPPQRRDQRLDRGPAADGGRREAALLDPRRSCVWRKERALWHVGIRRRAPRDSISTEAVHALRLLRRERQRPCTSTPGLSGSRQRGSHLGP